MSSRVYDSRVSDRPGCGTPSCNTELCRLPRNRADPHGYYAELGVDPAATDETIRARVRLLYRQLHPDTGARPDPDRLQRVKLIAEVLLDPGQRDRYNRTPLGKRLLDKVYRSELSALDLSSLDEDTVQRLLHPPAAPPVPPTRRAGNWYDYLAADRRPRDMLLAQRWYAHLVATAPLVGYRRRVTVMLHDDPPGFHPGAAILAIPRSWTPSAALAFGLWVAVAEQKHPSWGCVSSYSLDMI